MTTIHGTLKNEGVAIAVAAMVDAQHGVSGISPALLQDGLQAIRSGMEPDEFPEAVVVCDMLAVGASVRIPGVNVIGIAAQSAADVPGLEPEVPCVMGLPDLLQVVSHGDIVVVDGNRGVVHIDPDPQTLVHYQQIEERLCAKPPVFIESEHLPARTQSGATVLVYGLVSCAADLASALGSGADGLLVNVPEDTQPGFYAEVLTEAAGKPVVFSARCADMDLLRAAARFALPTQVFVALPADGLETLLEEAARALDSVAIEAELNDLDPPQVRFGIRAAWGESIDSALPVLVVDLGNRAIQELAQPSDGTVIVIGERVELIGHLVVSGVGIIGVAPGLVSDAKHAIRCVGTEDVE